ncbi:MAG: AbrB/MazE/SpoVT family DNA-binding domain-containing protein [Nitrososphaera sp.]
MAKFKAKLVKWGNSVGVSIPKPIRDSLELKAGDGVEIHDIENSIVIRKEGAIDGVEVARFTMNRRKARAKGEL